MEHRIMGNLWVQLINKQFFYRLLGHHSHNRKVQEQNMALPIINLASPTIT